MNAHTDLKIEDTSKVALRCLECGRNNLAPDDMATDTRFKSPTCAVCEKRIKSGYVPCSECHGSARRSNVRQFHSVRREFYNDWCPRCNGDGRVYVGVPKHLRGEDPAQTGAGCAA